jgi:Low-density lipoprotein receptor repeat class B
MKSSNLFVLFLSLLTFSLNAQQKIYWANGSVGIMSANLDGSDSKILIKNRILNLISIDIDTINNKIYWIDGQKKHIGRSNNDGTNTEILIEFTTSIPSNIRVDNTNNKIYWLETTDKKLLRANLDGTSRETMASNLPAGYGAFELDSRNNKIFWVDGTTNKILKTSLDNTVKEDIVVGVQNTVISNLKLDQTNKRIYWTSAEYTDSAKFTIKSRTFDGLNEKNIFTKKYSYSVGYFSYFEFEINPPQNTIYIRDTDESNGAGTFMLGNLDGTNLSFPHGRFTSFSLSRYRMDLKNNKLYAIGNYPYGIYSVSISSLQYSQSYITKETIISPNGIAVDKASGKIYWTDVQNCKIQRANIDGSNIENLITFGLFYPSAIALDLVNRHMYWTDSYFSHVINRANLDGTNVQTVYNVFGNSSGSARGITIYGIALDVPSRKIYYTIQGAVGIYRVGFDGTNNENILRRLRTFPNQLALDLDNKKIYWQEYGVTNGLMRANFDGTQVDTFLKKSYRTADGLALDITNKKAYWIGDSTLQRVNFDGSNSVVLLKIPLQNAYSFGSYMTWGASHSYTAGEVLSNRTNDLELLTGVKVFPTIFDKTIHIEVNESINEPIKYTINDLLGRTITNGLINNTATINQLESLEKGMYILELKTKNKYYSTKLIKE